MTISSITEVSPGAGAGSTAGGEEEGRGLSVEDSPTCRILFLSQHLLLSGIHLVPQVEDTSVIIFLQSPLLTSETLADHPLLLSTDHLQVLILILFPLLPYKYNYQSDQCWSDSVEVIGDHTHIWQLIFFLCKLLTPILFLLLLLVVLPPAALLLLPGPDPQPPVPGA